MKSNKLTTVISFFRSKNFALVDMEKFNEAAASIGGKVNHDNEKSGGWVTVTVEQEKASKITQPSSIIKTVVSSAFPDAYKVIVKRELATQSEKTFMLTLTAYSSEVSDRTQSKKRPMHWSVIVAIEKSDFMAQQMASTDEERKTHSSAQRVR